MKKATVSDSNVSFAAPPRAFRKGAMLEPIAKS
jgi:hypothetical protein